MIIDEIRYLRAKTEELRMDNRVEYQEYVDMCDSCDKIEEMLESTRWIPVSERLPEYDQAILYTNGIGRYTVNFRPCLTETMTHWMPLPLPPEQEV